MGRLTARPLVLCALLALARPAAAGEPLRWRDAMGREVSVAAPAARIVSLAPSATETIFALGAESLLVAVSRHCDQPVGAKLKPKAGDFNTPDLEKLLAFSPDVVLFAEYAKPADLDALGRAGIAAVVLPAATVDDVVAAIGRLGALTGRAGKAAEIAAGVAAAVAEITDRLAGVAPARRPGVYVVVDGPQQLYAVGPGSFMDDIVRLAGGRNVFAGKAAAYFPVDAAEVLAASPDVILIDYPFQYKVGLTKRPGWDALPAVRDGRVFDGTDYDIILFNRPGPRIAQALREVARLLHPELFRGR